MDPNDRRDFPARMAMLAETAAFVESFCERQGVGREDALRLTLIVEELFTNTIMHGFRGESESMIGVGLVRRGDHVEVFYEDRGPPHDPMERFRSSPVSLAAPLEARPVGGLGIHIVGQLTAGVRYAREEGMNRLWLVVTCRE